MFFFLVQSDIFMLIHVKINSSFELIFSLKDNSIQSNGKVSKNLCSEILF